MFRIYAAIAILAVLAGMGFYVHRLQAKAAKVDAAEARADDAERRALNIAENAVKAAAQERSINESLALFRGELGSQAASFREALAKQKLTREVAPHVNQTGTPSCYERDPVRYRELFNQAATGIASP